MRVLAITNMYPSRARPGWGSFIRSQVDSLRKAGIEVDVLVIEGYRSRWEYLRAIRRMRQKLRETRYDVIHAHYGLSGLVARCQFSIPIVVSFCGDDLYGHAGADGRRRLTSAPLAWVQRQLSRFVDASIVKSRAMNELLPRKDAVVIPNGVDMKSFYPTSRHEARKALGLDPERLYILFPYAPDRPRKNFDALRKAVSQVSQRIPRQPIEIVAVSGQPQKRLPLYMNACDLMVLPSFWEGSPNSVKEALACNLKIVATDVGDVRERLDGVAGAAICTPAADSIAEGIMAVLSDNRLVRGREAVAPLDIEKVAGRVIDVYVKVLSEKPRRRRTLIIVENLPVPFDRRVWQEAKALRDAGWQVRIICPKRGRYAASRETIEGIEIYRHPLPEARGALGYFVEYGVALFWQSFLALRIYLTHGFDVIHACNPPDLIFLVAAPFRWFGVRFIFDHHDLCPELAASKFGTGAKANVIRRILLGLERATFSQADASIATNESYRAIAIRRGGMAPERVHVVRSAPDLAHWQPVPPDPTLREGGEFLVGYVGVMGYQEGLANLLASVQHIVHEKGRTDIRFVLIGDGPELSSLKADAKVRRIEPWVDFTGRVPDDDLIRILSSCDICVNSDLATPFNNLSSMNKIVEYMALGKPIVQADLHEGNLTAMSASLCAAPDDPIDFAEKILELLGDPARRARMGADGRARVVEVLAWDRQVPRLLACYEQVIGLKAQPIAAEPSFHTSRYQDLGVTKIVGDDHG